MKKIVKTYKDKKVVELQKEEMNLREELAKLQLEKMSNPQKNTNLMRNKKRQLAVVLTLIKENKNK